MPRSLILYGLAALTLACSFTQKRSNFLEGITINEVPVESLSDLELFNLGYLDVLEMRLREEIKEQYGPIAQVAGREGVVQLLRLARVEYEQALKHGTWQDPTQAPFESAEGIYTQLLQRRYLFTHTPTTACSAAFGGFSAYVHRVYGDESARTMQEAAKGFIQQTRHCNKSNFGLFENIDALFNVK